MAACIKRSALWEKFAINFTDDNKICASSAVAILRYVMSYQSGTTMYSNTSNVF